MAHSLGEQDTTGHAGPLRGHTQGQSEAQGLREAGFAGMRGGGGPGPGGGCDCLVGLIPRLQGGGAGK